uniref:Uncharacterized protein n=1 Tax=Anopheles christyi TaxID=43041 RepID=A0A182KIF6_9DIPT
MTVMLLCARSSGAGYVWSIVKLDVTAGLFEKAALLTLTLLLVRLLSCQGFNGTCRGARCCSRDAFSHCGCCCRSFASSPGRVR